MIVNIKIRLSLILFICTLVESQGAYITNSLDQGNENQTHSLNNDKEDYIGGLSKIESANITENLLDDESGDLSTRNRKKQSHLKPPLFIKLMHEKITKDETSKLLVAENHSGPLLRAWLPLEISRDEATRTTTVHFQQSITREKIGNFTDARIILSLRDEIQLTDSGWWALNVLFPDKNISSKSLSSEIRFYDFNVTNYLRNTLSEKVEHPVPIILDFQVVHDENVLFLGDLFDVQVEQPFILLQYQNFPESLFTSLIKRHETQRRFSRSVQESATEHGRNSSVQDTMDVSVSEQSTVDALNALNPPPLIVGNRTILPSPSIEPPSKTCCRRYSLIVRPKEELHWTNVFKPSSFDLGYCSGSCPFPMQSEYYNHTLHTVLLDRYRLSKGFGIPSNLPHSTCVPTKYEDIHVLLDDEEDERAYELRLYKTILVAECGCR